MADQEQLNIFLDYTAILRNSDKSSLKVTPDYAECIRHISAHLREHNVKVSYMLSINGVYFNSESICKMENGDVITVLPVMGGG